MLLAQLDQAHPNSRPASRRKWSVLIPKLWRHSSCGQWLSQYKHKQRGKRDQPDHRLERYVTAPEDKMTHHAPNPWTGVLDPHVQKSRTRATSCMDDFSHSPVNSIPAHMQATKDTHIDHVHRRRVVSNEDVLMQSHPNPRTGEMSPYIVGSSTDEMHEYDYFSAPQHRSNRTHLRHMSRRWVQKGQSWMMEECLMSPIPSSPDLVNMPSTTTTPPPKTIPQNVPTSDPVKHQPQKCSPIPHPPSRHTEPRQPRQPMAPQAVPSRSPVHQPSSREISASQPPPRHSPTHQASPRRTSAHHSSSHQAASPTPKPRVPSTPTSTVPVASKTSDSICINKLAEFSKYLLQIITHLPSTIKALQSPGAEPRKAAGAFVDIAVLSGLCITIWKGRELFAELVDAVRSTSGLLLAMVALFVTWNLVAGGVRMKRIEAANRQGEHVSHQ